MPVRPTPDASGVEPNWPPRVRRLAGSVLACCEDWLEQPLQACVADFDARLRMAGAGVGLAERRAALATRARLAQDTETFERRFVRAVRQAFGRLGASAADAGMPVTSAAPTLSLLDPRAQECDSAMSHLVQRCELQGGQILVELGHRLAVLVAAPPLEGRDLPLSPQSMLEAFRSAAAPLDLPPEQTLVLLDSLDQTVMRPLAELQGAVNDLLQADGILPRVRPFSVPRSTRRGGATHPVGIVAPAATAPATTATPAVASAPAAPLPVDARSREAEALARQAPPPRLTPPTVAAPPPVALPATATPPTAMPPPTAQMDTPAPAAVPGLPPAAVPAPPAIARVATDVAGDDALRRALEALHWSLSGSNGHARSDWRGLHAGLLAQLKADAPPGTLDIRLSAQQAQAMAQVVRWFREAQNQLPRRAEIAALLAPLHWPLLCVVLSDPASCKRPGHPAYRLLRKAVEIVRDWLPGADGKNDPAVAARLVQTLQTLEGEPPDNARCDQARAELKQHIARWRERARAVERRHVEAMRGRERLERARRRASDLLAQRVAAAVTDDAVRALFDDAWTDVLALALLRQGESSTLVATLLVITDQLLGRLPTGDRQRLQQDVEDGLQQIGVYGDEAARMAQALMASSRSDVPRRWRRRPHSTVPAPIVAPEAAVEPVRDPVAEKRRTDLLARLRDSRFGGWFEFVDTQDGGCVQRRLAWFSALSGRCLFVTRRGQRADEMDLDDLAGAILAGRVRELPVAAEELEG